MTVEKLARFERHFPDIPWREPIKVRTPDMTEFRYACRVCVGINGLRGWDIEGLPSDPEVVREHIRVVHVEGLVEA